jgi:hypothetical protein
MLLTIKIDKNGSPVDEIRVQSVGPAGRGYEWYKLVHPPVPCGFKHRVADGDVVLATLALTALADAGYGQMRRDVTG